MARDGDPAKEPGNPDGCRISKKQVRQIGTSLAGLAEMFVRASNLIESSVRSITSQLANIKVGSGKAKGAGKGSNESPEFWSRFTPTENLEKSAAKIAKKQQSEAIKSAEQEEKEIIKAAMRGLSVRNATRLAAEAQEEKAQKQEEKAQKKEIEARKKYHDDLFKEQEKNTNKQIKQLESFQKRQASDIEKFRKAEAKAKADEAKIKANEEKKKVNEQIKEQKQIDVLRSKYSKALAAQQKRKANEEAKAKADEEKEIIKAAINGQKARDRIRKAEEKQKEDERKQIEKQENEIMKQAPIAYGLGKAFGFLTGSILKIGSDIAPQISKAARGLFAPKEMAPEESANLERQYLRYEGAPKREERARRRRETPVDPLAIREQEYNARKGVSKPPRGFSNGGQAKGTDTVPAMLTPGEIVVNKKASKKYGPLLDAINSGKVGGFARGGVVGPVAGAIGAVGRGAAGATSGLASGLDASGYTAAANAIRGLSRAIPAATSGFQALSIAAIGPIDIFNKLVGFAGSFVEAVNPALMQQLSMAFKDLQAVIGAGLQPIIAAAIPIIRAFADKLQPVMQALMPTFDKLAQSMIKMSGPIITILIEAFGALEPIITQISSVIEAWAGILAFLTPIISSAFKEIVYRVISLSTTFQWLIGKIISWVPGTGDLGKNLMESADASQKTADAYYSGASAVQKAIKADVKRGASAGAAARQASFTGISEFGRNLMQQAFSSSTQAAALKTAEYSEKTYNELAKMNAQLGRANPAAPARGVRGGP